MTNDRLLRALLGDPQSDELTDAPEPDPIATDFDSGVRGDVVLPADPEQDLQQLTAELLLEARRNPGGWT